MYHAALVGLKPGRNNDATMREAISLAINGKLQLSALAVIDTNVVAPRQAIPLGAAAFKERRDDAIKQQGYEDALAALKAFTELCRESGTDCTTVQREGFVDDEFALAAQSADVLILGHGGDTAACSGERSDIASLDKILRAVARPGLLVPCRPANVKRVTVAYDGSFQSARALYDFALSGLWRDCPVDVLTIAEEGSVATETAERGARYLALHGYASESHPLVTKRDAADNILKFIGDSGAGALVMGAYGKMRWREFVFGGVTRSVLQAVMVPVFLSH